MLEFVYDCSPTSQGALFGNVNAMHRIGIPEFLYGPSKITWLFGYINWVDLSFDQFYRNSMC